MKRSFSALLMLMAALLLFVPFAGAQEIVAAKKHVAAKTTCINCHGTNAPKEAASTEACLTCHKSGNGGYYYGKVDEKGQSIGWKISKSTFRAMVDSALGLDPRDETPATKAKRVLPGLKHLDGIVFAARIMVEPASNPQYRDQNRIANVVLPDDASHAAIMRGESVPPEPVNAPPRKAASVAAPGWQAPTPAWGAAPQPASTAAPAWGAQTAPAATAAPQTPAPAAPSTTAMPAWLNG